MGRRWNIKQSLLCELKSAQQLARNDPADAPFNDSSTRTGVWHGRALHRLGWAIGYYKLSFTSLLLTLLDCNSKRKSMTAADLLQVRLRQSGAGLSSFPLTGKRRQSKPRTSVKKILRTTLPRTRLAWSSDKCFTNDLPARNTSSQRQVFDTAMLERIAEKEFPV